MSLLNIKSSYVKYEHYYPQKYAADFMFRCSSKIRINMLVILHFSHSLASEAREAVLHGRISRFPSQIPPFGHFEQTGHLEREGFVSLSPLLSYFGPAFLRISITSPVKSLSIQASQVAPNFMDLCNSLFSCVLACLKVEIAPSSY